MVLTGFCVAPAGGVWFAPSMVTGAELTLDAGILIAEVIGADGAKAFLEAHKHEVEAYKEEIADKLHEIADGVKEWISRLSGEFVRAGSDNGKKLTAIDKAVYDAGGAGAGGGKKIYREAKRAADGKDVEFKKEAVTKERATELERDMKRGEERGIFSPNKEAAKELDEKDIKIHGQGKQGYYQHVHTDSTHRCHLWWRP